MSKALQIKVTLSDINPPIWRRILVKDDITLFLLSHIIQSCLDWDNSHMHEFTVNGMSIESGAERNIKISDLKLKTKSKIEYLYDFGDNWYHIIEIEKRSPIDTKQLYPFCIKAARACPPEDCGGSYGYVHLLDILEYGDKNSIEYEEQMEWIGEDFDPERANLKEINENIQERL